jgi:hypothetical protein
MTDEVPIVGAALAAARLANCATLGAKAGRRKGGPYDRAMA